MDEGFSTAVRDVVISFASMPEPDSRFGVFKCLTAESIRVLFFMTTWWWPYTVRKSVDSSVIGRMVGIRKPSKLPSLDEDIMILGSEHEVWRNNGMEAFTSSPVYRQRPYLRDDQARGELVCLDASTGEEHWVLSKLPIKYTHLRLGRMGNYRSRFQRKVFVVTDEGHRERSLAKWIWAPCLAAPSMAHGRVFVQTRKSSFALVPIRLLRLLWHDLHCKRKR